MARGGPQATTDGLLWAVDRQTFRHIIIAATREQRNSYETFLQNVPLFSNLTHSERSMIADCLEPREYKDGETIIAQGEAGDRFYLVEKGQAAAFQVPPRFPIALSLAVPPGANALSSARCARGPCARGPCVR
jgi:CRP-like cAMP-binding protein